MTFRRASAAGFWRLLGRPHPEGGGGLVTCAAAMPLVVLALAVTTDYASVSRFRTRVQLGADAASAAAAEAIARQPDRAGSVGDLAGRVATAVFIRHAPRGAAGAPTVVVRSGAAAVTASVGYAGLAPSNFGSALGYDAVTAEASATSLMRIADSRAAATR